MNRKRQAQVEEKAAQTLRFAKAYSYPVNLDRVAKSFNITLKEWDFGGEITTALIESEDGSRSTIGIGLHLTNQHYRRMAIAHAIGHYVLEHHHARRNNTCVDVAKYYWTIMNLSRLNNESASWDEHEYEANAFAAALLLPEELLLDAIKVWFEKTKFNEDDLMEHLSKSFNVSIQLLGLRMSTLKTLW